MKRLKLDAAFKNLVYEIVGQIPEGRVMTYGQIAAIAGIPNAAWEIGQLAHFGPEDLPWQRVVNKQGGLARGYTRGGLEEHKQALEAEGVEVSDDFRVDVSNLLWDPSKKSL